MTIQSAHRYLANTWDWAMFDGCFDNPRVALTDLDGALERNGYLLILETKAVGADLTGGQRIAFTNLSKTRATSVIVVWGAPQQPEECQVYHRGQVQDRQPCDSHTLRLRVARWYRWASEQPPAWTLTNEAVTSRPDRRYRQ